MPNLSIFDILHPAYIRIETQIQFGAELVCLGSVTRVTKFKTMTIKLSVLVLVANPIMPVGNRKIHQKQIGVSCIS